MSDTPYTPDPDALARLLHEHRAEIVGLISQLREDFSRPAKRWMSIDEAALYLGCSTRSIHRLISAGKLSTHRPLKGKLTLSVDEIDAVVRSSTGTPRRRRGVRLHRAAGE